MSDFRRAAGFGIYIHWPFCASKCPYCDFNSHVSDTIDPHAWLKAYESAIKGYREEIGPRTLRSIYFGGGTPSLMPVFLVEGILNSIRSAWSFSNDIEITLEANPGSVEVDRFRGYKHAGVDRVSLGVQALNDTDLKRLGRLHSAEQARIALETARNVFARASFDLIYARQDQSLVGWETELKTALEIAPDHMSLYQLTIEQGTAFYDRWSKGGLRGLPDEDLAADMYDLTQELMNSAQMPAYEISNHAAVENRSRHNLIYWHGGDYLGIGPGAHGRITLDSARFATETPLGPQNWLDLVAKNATGEGSRERLGQEDQLNELLMMGLRVRDGIPLENLQSLGFNADAEALLELQRQEFIDISHGSLVLTDKGRPVLNGVLREILV